MRLPRYLLAAISLVALAYAGASLAADKRESRPVAGFKGIDLAVAGKLEVIQDGTESLTLEGPEEVLADVETTLRGDGILLIRARTRMTWDWDRKLRISAHMKQVESIGVAGSADVHSDALRGPKLVFSIAGSGNIDVPSIETDAAHLVVSGSGDIRVAGRAASVSSNVSGSGNIKAPRLEARKATVTVAGSGDVALWVRDSLQVKIAGSGDVRYYGDPSIEKRIVGSGSVKRLGPAPT